jgi:adenosylcobyric acid synthase
VSGYEIHCGVTTFYRNYSPAVYLAQGQDGAMSDDGLIMGSYLHGLFESAEACAALLNWAGLQDSHPSPNYHALCEATFNRLADSIEQCLDTRRLCQLLDLQGFCA